MSTSQTKSAMQSQDLSMSKYEEVAQGSSCSLTQNISEQERQLSLGGGAALLLVGLLSRRFGGLLTTGLGAGLLYRGLTGHCKAYEMMGIDTAEHSDATAIPAKQGVHVEKSFFIQASPETLYSFWKDLKQLPTVMKHIKSVEVRDDKRSHWVAEDPLGRDIEWDAEIINDKPNEMLAWKSLPGSDLETAGSVHFKAHKNRGTEVTVSMKYNPPGGKFADWLASLFGSGLEQRVHEDLRAFRQKIEAGELPTTEGQPSGRS